VKKLNFGTILFIVVIVFFIYVYIDTTLNEKDIKNNGKEISATVLTCREEFNPPRSANSDWTSRAYYKVKGKEYSYPIRAIVPVGTIVKIRYAQRDPTRAELINPHEFDHYPKKPPLQKY
jgi:hypothetical protein